jgi:nitrite reductase (cytochrome c-552)
MVDFIMSENSMGFHAPQEAARILSEAINQCRLGQIAFHDGPQPQPAKECEVRPQSRQQK